MLAPPLVAAGYTLFALDAPGYGDSPPLEPEGYAPANIAGLAAGLLDELGLAPAVWIGYSWGASIGLHTAARFPSAIRALGLLDGGYLVAEDDPDYDPKPTTRTRWRNCAAGQRKARPGMRLPRSSGRAMVASRLAPCTALYPAIAESGIPILLARATEPPEFEPIGEPHSTGSAPDSPRRASCRSRMRRTASSATTRAKVDSHPARLALRARTSSARPRRDASRHHVGELLVDDLPAPRSKAAVRIDLDAPRIAEGLDRIKDRSRTSSAGSTKSEWMSRTPSPTPG